MLGAMTTSGTLSFTVEESDTAASLGSGDLAVLGTPRLLAWAEAATCAAIVEELTEEQTSVGTRVALEHLGGKRRRRAAAGHGHCGSPGRAAPTFRSGRGRLEGSGGRARRGDPGRRRPHPVHVPAGALTRPPNPSVAVADTYCCTGRAAERALGRTVDHTTLASAAQGSQMPKVFLG